MIRMLMFCLVLVMAAALKAEPVPDDITKVISVQRAMIVARQHLAKSQPDQAVAVLEVELVNAHGNSSFQKLLKDAYSQQLSRLDKAAESHRVEAIRRKIKALESDSTPPDTLVKNVDPNPPAKLKSPLDVELPPIPKAPETPAVQVDEEPSRSPVIAPTYAREPSTAEMAEQAFADKNFRLAYRIYADAVRQQVQLSPEQREQWGYCRLFDVAQSMGQSGSDMVMLERRVQAVLDEGNPKLQSFADRLMRELRSGSPSPATTDNLIRLAAAVASTGPSSFRIDTSGNARLSAEIQQTAESARKELSERWMGPVSGVWSPPCEIVVHANAEEYARATGKSSHQPGHCTVKMTGEKIVSRRIDLRADDRHLLDMTLPNQITQVLLAEWFSEQPLPRWAMIGIAALSESPEGVARYRKAAHTLLYQQKLFAVAPFVDLKEIPNADSVTQYYAESVALVEYLVRQRGAKPFLAFLREGPRRGYEKALKSHYGFRDYGELQDRWVKYLSGETE